MSMVRRVYVEKKPGFAVQAEELRHEIQSYLGIKQVTGVRVLIRYDVEDLRSETFEKACQGIFAELRWTIFIWRNFQKRHRTVFSL